MKTENLSTLKIHKISQEQYNREYEAGRIDPTAIYLTPEASAVPAPTTSDEGKFLRVINGVIIWQALPQAEEALF